jgi:hypothetical protein
LNGWSGGWQPDKGQPQLDATMIPDLSNVVFTEGYGIEKRKGYEKVSDDITGTKEVSTIDRGSSTGGTWTLQYFYPLGSGTTGNIAYDANNTTVKAAVEATNAITTATVTGAGTGGDPWIITIDDPISGWYVVGDDTNLTGGDSTLTVTETVQGLSAQDVAGQVLIKHVEKLVSNYPRFEQQVFYINENDGHIFRQSLGEILKDFESEGNGTDFVRSGFALGPWTQANGPRPWSVQAITFGDSIYITSQRVGGTQSNGQAHMTHDGTDLTHTLPVIYDAGANSWSTLAVHLLAGATSGFPTARCLLNHYDRIFAGNVVNQTGSSDYRYRSRIYWSDAGTAETWKADSYITVGADDDGSDITNITPFRESIIILKQDSFWSLVGTDEDTFALYSLSDRYGTEATYGAVADESLFYFFDSTAGVIAYNGVQFTNISEPINTGMLADLNRAATFKTTLWLDENRLYVSIPVGDFASGPGDHATRTYVYDIRLKVWTKWTIGYVPDPTQDKLDTVVATTDADLFTGKFFAGGINDTVGLMRVEATDNDAGVAISSYFETIWINPGDVGEIHRLRRLDIVTDSPDGTITTDVYRNFNDTTAFSTGTFTPVGTLDQYHLQDQSHDGSFWSWLKIKLTNNVVSESFKVNVLGGSYSTRRQSRMTHGGLNQ